MTSFWDAYTKVMAALAPLIAAGLAIVAGVFLLLRRDFMCQMENANKINKKIKKSLSESTRLTPHITFFENFPAEFLYSQNVSQGG